MATSSKADASALPVVTSYKLSDMVAEPETVPRNELDAQIAENLNANSHARQRMHKIIYGILDSLLESQEFADKVEENIAVSESLTKVIEDSMHRIFEKELKRN